MKTSPILLNILIPALSCPVFVSPTFGIAIPAPQEHPHPIKPLIITVPIPGPKNNDDTAGGVIVADVNQDQKPDFLVTCRGHIAAIDNSGKKLWVKKTDVVANSKLEYRNPKQIRNSKFK